MENSNNSKTGMKIIGSLVVIAAIGYAAFQFNKSAPETPTPSSTPSTNPVPVPGNTPPIPTTMGRKYKDGTYTAVGNYINPVSKEEVNVELVLKDGVVMSAKFSGTPDNATTKTMQGKFNSGFETLVVGKNIDDINLTVVNGSSLTPGGFMDALAKIKDQANV